MNTEHRFDMLIVVTPTDCERVLKLYPRLVDKFDNGNLCFIGAPGVGELVRNSAIAERAGWIDENSIVPFDEVHACMKKRLEPILQGEDLPRGVTGWYYQQFLKMQYSAICKDEYYMVWDGDTIPCRQINMFSPETGQPYFDLKYEHHPEYFETIGKILPGFGKVIERSFISEHMIFRCDIMQNLIKDIEKNDSIPGTRFWEKIINAIPPEKIGDSCFSEFETYGTYVALRYMNVYKLREWHSFRLGASFFEMDKICDRDFEWLAVDFDAISFEKGQSVAEGNGGYFDNPEVQAKISAKRLLQAVQMDYQDGYKEVWDDDPDAAKANTRSGSYGESKAKNNLTLIVMVSNDSLSLMKRCIDSIRDNLQVGTYLISVIDRVESDEVSEYLSAQEDVLLIRDDDRVSFGAECNFAVEATKGSDYETADVLLFDSKAVFIYDSLYFLRHAVYSSDDIGAAGSISNYAKGLQHVDVSFNDVEEYIKYGERVNVRTTDAAVGVDRLEAFSMLIKRKVWDAAGGLDEDAVPAGSEADGLCDRIAAQGYRLCMIKNSFIYREN